MENFSTFLTNYLSKIQKWPKFEKLTKIFFFFNYFFKKNFKKNFQKFFKKFFKQFFKKNFQKIFQKNFQKKSALACTGLHWLAETCKFKTHVWKIPYKFDNLIATSQVLMFLKSQRTNEYKNIIFLKNPIPQLDSYAKEKEVFFLF